MKTLFNKTRYKHHNDKQVFLIEKTTHTYIPYLEAQETRKFTKNTLSLSLSGNVYVSCL